MVVWAWSRLVLGASLVVAGGLVSGCTTGGGHSVEHPTPTSSTAAVALVEQEIGFNPLKYLNPLDKRILADGKVTIAELDESTESVRECLVDAGFTVKKSPPNPHFPIDDHTINSLSIFNPPPPSGAISALSAVPGTEGDPKIASCENPGELLAFVWAYEHQKSEADVRKAQNAYVSCMHKLNIGVKKGASYQDAVKVEVKEQNKPDSDDSPLGSAVTACDVAYSVQVGQRPPDGLAEALGLKKK